MWRWSWKTAIVTLGNIVFSTYVEVILFAALLIVISSGILHVCGGDPVNVVDCITTILYSPRMWRWSWVVQKAQPYLLVFSTYVEVIPTRSIKIIRGISILHVCGGDPSNAISTASGDLYSPRMWRWSHKCPLEMRSRNVFSTYVEVILPLMPSPARFFGILHVCGGDPKPRLPSWSTVMYSPRMWRWS